MSSENFKILKEIGSLDIMQSKLRDEISSEEARIAFVEKNRAKRDSDKEIDQKLLAEAKEQMAQLENSISHNQLLLDQDKKHLLEVKTNDQLINLEHQIKDREEQIGVAEDQGLEFLDKIDGYENHIKECTTFLSGSLESLNEIIGEVEAVRTQKNKEITSLHKRSKLLVEELPKAFQDKLSLVVARKIKLSSFTRIINNACEFCRMSVCSADVTSVEEKLALKTCSQCGRLFIPQQALY